MKNKIAITHPRTLQTTMHYPPSDELLAEAERACEYNSWSNRGSNEGVADERRLETIRKLKEQK